MNADSTELPPLENLLVAALYLATSFARSGCPRMSHMILHQLEFVLKHPRKEASPMVHDTCKRLYDAWEAIHAECQRALANEEPLAISRQAHLH